MGGEGESGGIPYGVSLERRQCPDSTLEITVVSSSSCLPPAARLWATTLALLVKCPPRTLSHEGIMQRLYEQFPCGNALIVRRCI